MFSSLDYGNSETLQGTSHLELECLSDSWQRFSHLLFVVAMMLLLEREIRCDLDDDALGGALECSLERQSGAALAADFRSLRLCFAQVKLSAFLTADMTSTALSLLEFASRKYPPRCILSSVHSVTLRLRTVYFP